MGFALFSEELVLPVERPDNVFSEKKKIKGFFLPFYVHLVLLIDVSRIFQTSTFIKF